MEKNKPSFLSCAKRQQRWAIRKLSIGVCSVLLGVMLMVPSLGTVYAQENRGLDTTTHYTATGIDNNANLRYSSTVFNKVEDDDSLSMTFTYWFSGSAGWGTDPANKYAGKYLLSCTNNTFYKQIDKVILADISLEKHNDGAMWSLPVTKLPNYALIGLSRNQPVKITLKNGQTLESLNLQDTPIGFNSVLTTNKGAIASNSISNGYILLNNKKESGFTKGKANQRIKFNIDDMTIRSIHTFKPDENFLQTDYSWVVYVKEQIAPELLPYIDTDNIKIYCSDLDGVKINKNHEEFTVPINDQGLVDTSQVPELSIIGNDTKAQLDAARKNIDRIFFGTLGQSRSYTISYKLKDSVTLSDFARAANEYIKKNQQSFLFDSWMEADYLNTKQGVSTNDNGDAPKQLNNSYANAYLDANDTDKDGLFDFVEWKIGTDTTKVDTDGDGVPDGQEFMIDLTEPNNAADYLVSKPTTTTTTFDSTKKTTIEGTVPKTLIADPADPARLIQITNENAGNVIVKLQGYDKNTKTYTTDEYGTVKIPYKDLVAGNFSLDVNANVVPDGTEVVLVAYSPNADNPIMGDPFTFTTPDADKYNVKGGTLNQDYGKKAEEAAILDKVTVTETKDGQEAPTPAEKVKSKVIKGEIPTPTADGADQTVTVEVTYADGTKEDATVTIAYGEAKDAYVPEGQKVDVNKGEDPSAEAGIKNKDDLPEGTTYDWKTPVDTDTPGETTGTIVVTYPDGSKEEVEVTVNVVDPATDADKYNAKGGTLNQDYGKKAEEAAILDKVTVTETKDGQEAPAPAEKVKSKAIKGEIPTPTADGADQTVTVEVTYADGTKEDATVTIAYGEAKDAYVPEGQKVDVNKGEDPSAEAGIKNKDDLPEGTMYDWKTPVDTDTPGETIGTIVVTYPDGSKEEVEVTVNVVDTTPQATDTELYTAQGGVVNKPYGQTATNDEVIGVVTTDAPAEKIQSIVAVDAIPTTGQNQPVNVKVTYVDGTNDTVIVTVNYGLATDAYDPAGQAITVDKGSQPNAADGIANKADLPANTTYGWAAPVDTSTPGTTSGTIVVTYPDGSTDQVTVDVIVNENATNTELYTAQGGVVNKPYGQTATNDEVIGVVTTDAPAEKIQSIVAVDAIPTTGQNQPVNVKVTYVDGTNDTVIVTVNYGLATDAYDPAGQAITVDKGSQPNAADGIANKADLPANTTYGWTAPVDTSTPGTTSGTVVVTYPDGSTDQVTVDVIVNDNRTDAEKYTPEGQEVNVNKGETPNPEDGIRNKDDLPEDTKYEWKTPVNTDKPGETPGIIVVTYPDGTTEEVEVKVNVTDPRTDADKYDPETKPEIIKPGENPDLTDNVTNLDDLPEGTQIKDITPEGTIDPNKPGEYEGTLEIQYPDGSKETVTVKVTVEKPASTVTPVNNQQNTQTNKVTKVTTSGPKTGDFTNLGVHTAAAIGSIATLAGLFFARKRRKVDEEQ